MIRNLITDNFENNKSYFQYSKVTQWTKKKELKIFLAQKIAWLRNIGHREKSCSNEMLIIQIFKKQRRLM